MVRGGQVEEGGGRGKKGGGGNSSKDEGAGRTASQAGRRLGRTSFVGREERGRKKG